MFVCQCNPPIHQSSWSEIRSSLLACSFERELGKSCIRCEVADADVEIICSGSLNCCDDEISNRGRVLVLISTGFFS